jgi:hypothetical protein
MSVTVLVEHIILLGAHKHTFVFEPSPPAGCDNSFNDEKNHA